MDITLEIPYQLEQPAVAYARETNKYAEVIQYQEMAIVMFISHLTPLMRCQM